LKKSVAEQADYIFLSRRSVAIRKKCPQTNSLRNGSEERLPLVSTSCCRVKRTFFFFLILMSREAGKDYGGGKAMGEETFVSQSPWPSCGLHHVPFAPSTSNLRYPRSPPPAPDRLHRHAGPGNRLSFHAKHHLLGVVHTANLAPRTGVHCSEKSGGARADTKTVSERSAAS
jgi:hypothetical protein